jgi:hypothetical protein
MTGLNGSSFEARGGSCFLDSAMPRTGLVALGLVALSSAVRRAARPRRAGVRPLRADDTAAPPTRASHNLPVARSVMTDAVMDDLCVPQPLGNPTWSAKIIGALERSQAARSAHMRCKLRPFLMVGAVIAVAHPREVVMYSVAGRQASCC